MSLSTDILVRKPGQPDIDTLLYAIIGEAEVALKRKNFQHQIEHIHCVVDLIENRIKDWEARLMWSEIDRLWPGARVKDDADRRKIGGFNPGDLLRKD